MTQVNPRRRPTDYRWDQLRAKFKAHCRMVNALCHICVARGDVEHAQIDYSAPPRTPNAFEADHLMPWEHFPHLRYEWHNLGAAHSRCNRQRGDDPIEPKQEWVKPDW